MKQNMSKEEIFILQRMIDGDEDAFKYFFDTYYDDLCNFVNSYLRDEVLSEEIVQDIFVYFWEKRSAINFYSSVKSYLYTASKNRSLNYLRDRKNQKRISDKLVSPSDFVTNEADQYLEVEELRRIISQAIEGLPAKCREIYCLSRDGGMSNHEIAEELGVSVKTVENQITIAIRKIKDFLRPYNDKIFILFLILLGG